MLTGIDSDDKILERIFYCSLFGVTSLKFSLYFINFRYLPFNRHSLWNSRSQYSSELYFSIHTSKTYILVMKFTTRSEEKYYISDISLELGQDKNVAFYLQIDQRYFKCIVDNSFLFYE